MLSQEGLPAKLGILTMTMAVAACGVAIEDRTDSILSRQPAANYPFAAEVEAANVVLTGVQAEVTTRVPGASVTTTTLPLEDSDGDGTYEGIFPGNPCAVGFDVAYVADYRRGGSPRATRAPGMGSFLKWVDGEPPDGCPAPRRNPAIRVDTPLDLVDPVPGDDQCGPRRPGEDSCSLRAAIMTANARPGPDLIVLAADEIRPYRLTLRGAPEDRGVTGDLDITDSVTIVGEVSGRPDLFRVDASGLGEPAIEIHRLPEGGLVEIAGLTLQASGRESPVATGSGGGLVHRGVARLSGVVMSGNRGAQGGAITNFGWLAVERSRIVDSRGAAGAIFNGRDAFARLEGISIDSNRATGLAGGIFNAGRLEVLSSTIVRNVTSGGGGGIASSELGSALLRNVTISDNEAGAGGGLAIFGRPSAVRVANRVIAGNRATGRDAGKADCDGQFLSLGHNLIGIGDGCTRERSTLIGTAISPVAPGLEPLVDLSLSSSLRPMPASPLIDRGSPAAPGEVSPFACTRIDQLGTERPQPAGGRCDIGAVERVPASALF